MQFILNSVKKSKKSIYLDMYVYISTVNQNLNIKHLYGKTSISRSGRFLDFLGFTNSGKRHLL